MARSRLIYFKKGSRKVLVYFEVFCFFRGYGGSGFYGGSGYFSLIIGL